jgi:hypothetical protein
MRSAMAESLNDVCQIGTVVETPNSHYTSTTVTYGANVACGFSVGRGDETQGEQNTISDGTVRLPLGSVVTASSMIKLISRGFYTLPTPEVYAVQGDPQSGMVHLVVRLKALPSGGVG